MTQKERVVRGAVCSSHMVQFFDTPTSLANGVARFLAEGLAGNETLLVVARSRNWKAIATCLRSRGCAVAGAVKSGRLVVLDAAATLEKFMRAGLPDSVLFDQVVGQLVSELAGRRGASGLRIYGEMVELLAEERNFYGACRLEELWNELAVRHSFQLLCGYSAAHFASRDAEIALASICQTHTHVHRNPKDLLSEWILRSQPHSLEPSLTRVS
jgi:DcmR-like sensory protein